MLRKILCLSLACLLLLPALALAADAPPPEGHLRVLTATYLDNTNLLEMNVLLDTGEEVVIPAPVPAEFFAGATVSPDNVLAKGTIISLTFHDGKMHNTITEGYMLYNYTFDGESTPRSFPFGAGTLMAYTRDGDTFTYAWAEQPPEVAEWIAAQEAE